MTGGSEGPALSSPPGSGAPGPIMQGDGDFVERGCRGQGDWAAFAVPGSSREGVGHGEEDPAVLGPSHISCL